jgi:hypothetical protein
MKRAAFPLAAVLIGGCIYILWRPDNLVMFHWFAVVGAGGLVATLRDVAASYAHFFPTWFYYSLPQALWFYSGLRAFDIIWGGRHPAALKLWASMFGALAFGSELAQGLGLVPGTFDWLDLGLLVVAFFAAFYSYLSMPIVKGKDSNETSCLARTRSVFRRAVDARNLGIW